MAIIIPYDYEVTNRCRYRKTLLLLNIWNSKQIKYLYAWTNFIFFLCLPVILKTTGNFLLLTSLRTNLI